MHPLSPLRRGAAAALVLCAAVACSDATAPMDLSPGDMESMGYSVAGEIQAAIHSFDAPPLGDPVAVFRRAPSIPPEGLFLNRLSAEVTTSGCGVPSQDPIVDSDQDMIPDDVTVTYSLPACRTTDETSTIEITGSIRLRDPLPATPGFSFELATSSLRFALFSTDGSFALTHNGTASVSVSGTGLAQSHDYTIRADVTGSGSATLASKWNLTFVPNEGESLVVGQPLPNGIFTPAGTSSITSGKDYLSFTLTTPVPLQYDATCAQSNESPFQSGEIHIRFAGNEGKGFVRVRYVGCAAAEVVFVGV